MSKNNTSRNRTRQKFLLTFFPDASKRYEEKEINGFWLVKHIVNGDPTHFEVAIYSKESFTRAAEYKKDPKKFQFNIYKEVDQSYQQFKLALAKED